MWQIAISSFESLCDTNIQDTQSTCQYVSGEVIYARYRPQNDSEDALVEPEACTAMLHALDKLLKSAVVSCPTLSSDGDGLYVRQIDTASQEAWVGRLFDLHDEYLAAQRKRGILRCCQTLPSRLQTLCGTS